jgi:hypothetical protein
MTDAKFKPFRSTLQKPEREAEKATHRAVTYIRWRTTADHLHIVVSDTQMYK